MPKSIKPNSTKVRCWWCLNDPIYIKYHDQEWGVPVHNDRKIFEMLTLEAFQAGLSWLTVLKKRAEFKKSFANFDPKKVSKFTKKDVARLMNNAGIIRNKMKIEAAINNAARFLEIQKEFKTFDKYIWSFTNHKVIRSPKKVTPKTIRATSPESDALSKDLKARGFKFVGSTIIYAHMQATGMVNDHAVGCYKR